MLLPNDLHFDFNFNKKFLELFNDTVLFPKCKFF